MLLFPRVDNFAFIDVAIFLFCILFIYTSDAVLHNREGDWSPTLYVFHFNKNKNFPSAKKMNPYTIVVPSHIISDFSQTTTKKIYPSPMTSRKKNVWLLKRIHIVCAVSPLGEPLARVNQASVIRRFRNFLELNVPYTIHTHTLSSSSSYRETILSERKRERAGCLLSAASLVNSKIHSQERQIAARRIYLALFFFSGAIATWDVRDFNEGKLSLRARTLLYRLCTRGI